MNILKRIIGALFVMAMTTTVQTAVQAEPMTGSFTFQGQLKHNDVPFNGEAHLQFFLHTSESGNASVGRVNKCFVPIQNGLFTVELEFPPTRELFSGEQRWLEVRVADAAQNECDSRGGGGGTTWEVLSPRTKITAAPQAVYAMGTSWTGLSDVPAGFADGVDDVGGFTLPLVAEYGEADTALMTLTHTGIGSAVRLLGNDSGNYYELLFASNAGPGPTMMSMKPPDSSGMTAQFQNLSETNPFPAVMIKNEANTAGLQVDASQTGAGYGISANTYGSGWAAKFTGPDNNGVNATLIIQSPGPQRMRLDGNEIDSETTSLYLNYNSEMDVILARGGGRVGIGRTNPGRMLHIGDIGVPNSEGMIRFESRSGTNASNRAWDIGVPEKDSDTSGTGYSFIIDDIQTGATEFMIKYGTGQVGIGFSSIPAGVKLAVNGKALVDVLEIQGGSDLSETFDINGENVEPGMVVVIDPDSAGGLMRSSQAYDRKVAGIISGAGGIRPGMVMGQKGSVASGAYPVALTGRVYCFVDASEHAIIPGDLLTTSDTPGYAMKVTDHQQAAGATIGKAMTKLALGEKGLVLVLVNLH